jgi:hypothetical protein
MRHVTSPRKRDHGQRHTLDAGWSMQDALSDQSPDPYDEDSDGLPYGLHRDIRPGNTAKFLTTEGPFNRTAVSVTALVDDLHTKECLSGWCTQEVICTCN